MFVCMSFSIIAPLSLSPLRSLWLSPPPLAPSFTLSLSPSGSMTGMLNGMCRESELVLPPHAPVLRKLPIIFHWLTSTHHQLQQHNKFLWPGTAKKP